MNVEGIAKQDISTLEIRDSQIIQVLEQNNIKAVEDLVCMSKLDLKQLDLKADDINYISIKLQLQGLDLRDNKLE